MKDTKILDIGSGDNPVKGSLTLDRLEKFDPDLVHDIENLPLPFEDERFEKVYMRDVLEHLPADADFLDELFSELQRILVPGGTLYIRVPYYTGREAAGDVQHTRTGYSYSFHLDYVDTDMEVAGRRIVFPKRRRLPWNYILEPVANRIPFFWEHTALTYIFPAKNLEVEIKK